MGNSKSLGTGSSVEIETSENAGNIQAPATSYHRGQFSMQYNPVSGIAGPSQSHQALSLENSTNNTSAPQLAHQKPNVISGKEKKVSLFTDKESREILEKMDLTYKRPDVAKKVIYQKGNELRRMVKQRLMMSDDTMTHQQLLDDVLFDHESLLHTRGLHFSYVEFKDEDGLKSLKPTIVEGRAFVTNIRVILLSADQVKGTILSKYGTPERKRLGYTISSYQNEEHHYQYIPLDCLKMVELHARAGGKADVHVTMESPTCTACGWLGKLFSMAMCSEQWSVSPTGPSGSEYNERVIMIWATMPPWMTRMMLKLHVAPDVPLTVITEFVSRLQRFSPSIFNVAETLEKVYTAQREVTKSVIDFQVQSMNNRISDSDSKQSCRTQHTNEQDNDSESASHDIYQELDTLYARGRLHPKDFQEKSLGWSVNLPGVSSPPSEAGVSNRALPAAPDGQLLSLRAAYSTAWSKATGSKPREMQGISETPGARDELCTSEELSIGSKEKQEEQEGSTDAGKYEEEKDEALSDFKISAAVAEVTEHEIDAKHNAAVQVVSGKESDDDLDLFDACKVAISEVMDSEGKDLKTAADKPVGVDDMSIFTSQTICTGSGIVNSKLPADMEDFTEVNRPQETDISEDDALQAKKASESISSSDDEDGCNDEPPDEVSVKPPQAAKIRCVCARCLKDVDPDIWKRETLAKPNFLMDSNGEEDRHTQRKARGNCICSACLKAQGLLDETDIHPDDSSTC